MAQKPDTQNIEENTDRLKSFARKFRGAGAATPEVQRELEELQNLTSKLLDVGVAISSEIDLYALLVRIIDEAKRLLHADRGTLYLVDQEKNELYFHVTDDKQIKEIRLPINKQSIAGYVALTGKQLNIKDVYRIPESRPYTFNKSVDRKSGYRTRSMLTVPMVNHQGEVTGAVQLINKMRDGEVTAFSERDRHILMSLASQAAVSIENAQLYKEVADLFDAFVRYSASAIDERDPATAGHSRRVAMYATALARAMGCFSEQEVKELEYAAWLHDVGKIGVREHILIKENKLFPNQRAQVCERFQAIKLSIQKQSLEQKIRLMETDASPERIRALDEKAEQEIRETQDELDFVLRIDKPGFMNDEDMKRVDRIARRRFAAADGTRQPWLTAQEKAALKVRRGNLTEAERKIMNAHVESTYKILSQIPFTRRLRRVPEIAASHHEKLDGSGYPHKLRASKIPVQARILALVDIYDALTAQDRPYKPAMPVEKSLDILRFEVKDGHLDPEIFNAFLDNKIYLLEDPGPGATMGFEQTWPFVPNNKK